MILDPMTIMQNFDFNLAVKIVSLTFIGLYAIFAFMLATKIKSFNKILFLPPDSGGGLMQLIAIIYVIVVLFLFLLGLIVI